MLIRGASGSGKSGLALTLMALGAGLIADDRTILTRVGASLIAACPPSLLGMIEARGVGILRATPIAPAPVALVVDLDRTETQRLPEHLTTSYLGLSVPLLQKVESNHFPAAILQYLTSGKIEE